jgi:preprotein translocase subunit YajC
MQYLFPLLIVAMLVPTFFAMRRQKAEAAKTSELQRAIKVGDRVITTSGLYGTVVEADDTTVDLEIAEDVVTTWLRAAVREIRKDDTAVESVEPLESTNGHAPIAVDADDAND